MPTTGTVEFHAADGKLQTVRVGATDVSTVRYNLPGHGLEVVTTADSGSRRGGYVAIRPDDGQDAPISRGILNLQQNGRLVAMTGMNVAAASKQARALLDFSVGHDSAVALLNDSNRRADIRLMIYNDDGNPVLTSTSIALGAQSQITAFISEFFPDLPRGFRGTVEFASDGVIQGVALRTTLSGGRLLTSVFPIEPVDAPRNERVLFFPYLLDGGTLQSEIFIASLGTGTSAPRLSFLSQAGAALRLMFSQTR
jgi:hypothetical protein